LKKVIDAKSNSWQAELRETLRAGVFADVINIDAIKDHTELPRIARQFGAHLELDPQSKLGMLPFRALKKLARAISRINAFVRFIASTRYSASRIGWPWPIPG